MILPTLLFLAPLVAHAGTMKPAKPLNVLIIGADTLRADHLSLYGYSRPTSPNIDAIAARAIVFDLVFSQGSYTLSSFASLFTSRYLEQHYAINKFTAIQDSETMLADVFNKAGYRTAGFTGGPNLTLQYGFGKGFDTYLSGDLPRQLDAYIPVALKWIEKDRSKPFFLFLQPQDVHPPFDVLELPEAERDRWDPGDHERADRYMGSFYFFKAFNGQPYSTNKPEPSQRLKKELAEAVKDPRVKRHMISLYDDRIAHMDRSFGLFFKELEKMGVLDDTVVVLLSDHGTLFGEGGNFTHGNHMSTHDGIFHVVLAVWAPGLKARRVRSLVELVDVAPTLLEMANLPVPKVFEGRSLLPLMAGREDSQDRTVYGASSATWNESGKVNRFVRDSRWKFVSADPGGKTALYDLSADPEEINDVSAAQPEVVKRLSGALARHLQSVMARTE
ncbi:MAG: sulfatase [Elusimicrobiota bacterium]